MYSTINACAHCLSFFHQMRALKMRWKRLFILSKKLFSFSRYWFFLFPSSPYFCSFSYCSRRWSNTDFKVRDAINLGKQEFKKTWFDILRMKDDLIVKLVQKTPTFWPSFMDRVQLPQGYRATTNRQFSFYQ